MIPALSAIARASHAHTAVDLFSGTTRVAQAFKHLGMEVTASDVATYTAVFSDCFIATDAAQVNRVELEDVINELNNLPGSPGYFTDTFCIKSHFFQPFNGEKIDAIRNYLAENYAESPIFPILLTSLLLAADKVDSTTGLQMAYLKSWAPRSYNPLCLKVPDIIEGGGRTILGDALDTVTTLNSVDLMYMDPPYNQHRYFTNYHIWETLVRWDNPLCYGVACKREDARSESTKSIFNRKRLMPIAFASLLEKAKTHTLVVSYNNESWITAEEMMEMIFSCGYEDVRMLSFDYKRYVGAQIGIHNQRGEKIGKIKRLQNQEYVFIAGDRECVQRCAEAGENAKRNL